MMPDENGKVSNIHLLPSVPYNRTRVVAVHVISCKFIGIL